MGLDNSAQILVIILAVFLGLFLTLAVILLIMLLRITKQIKKITDVAGTAAEQLNGVFGSMTKIALPTMAPTIAKFIFRQARKAMKKRAAGRKSVE